MASGSASALRIAAPATAGFMVAALGTGPAFGFQALVLAAAAVALATTRLTAASKPPSPAGSPLRQLRDGWAEFARLRWLWLLTGEWAIFSLVILAPVTVLGPVIALHDLGGAAAWGLIGSYLALGAVAGQAIAGFIRSPARPARLIACLVPAMTGEAMALGLGAPLPAIVVATVASGVAFGVQAVIFSTAMQIAIPPGMLSRVTAIDLLASEAGQPAGYALAGPIGQAAGPHAVLATTAIAMFIAASAFPALRPLRAGIKPPGQPQEQPAT